MLLMYPSVCIPRLFWQRKIIQNGAKEFICAKSESVTTTSEQQQIRLPLSLMQTDMFI